MEIFEALLGRESVSPKFLTAPAPSEAERQRAFQAAMTAPDHGALRPWRFLVVEGDGLLRLADVYGESARREQPDADPAVIETAREKALRSPLLIVCAAATRDDHPKVPPVEQLAAASCATQNLLTAFHAMGYGAMLVTGPRAYDAYVKEQLGLAAADHIVGFMHVGTPAPDRPAKAKKRPETAHHVRPWPA